MALSSPESPAPQRRVFINRVETPTEEQEELNKMAHGVVAESRRYVKPPVVVFTVGESVKIVHFHSYETFVY